MKFVLDASATLAWFFEDEFDSDAQRIRDHVRGGEAVAPMLWPTEVINGLLMAERRGRIPAAKVDAAALLIEALPVAIEVVPPACASLVALARRHQRTAYDALYLDLAIRHGCPLATRDRGLRQAADEARVAILL